MKAHVLKIWPIFFDAVARGEKSFEVRKNDRDFQPGDEVTLKEWNPKTEEFTGRELNRLIIYVFKGGSFGVQEGFVVFSMLPIYELLTPPK